jgi:hypothetical protein
MHLYLDAKDLINVLERSEPVTPDQLAQLLVRGSSKLAISFASIAEIAAPLLHRGARTNVMAILGELEKLPLVFIADARIKLMELEEAVVAFRSGREYLPIDPYVVRFDHTIPVWGDVPTGPSISYSIAETVWDLWSHEPKLLDGYAAHRNRYKESIANDRRATNPPSLRSHFPVVVETDLAFYRIDSTGVDARALGSWIYESPDRCPGKRLEFEAWHRLRANKADQLLPSDITDFNHLYNLPYVDVFTADRRMRAYLDQVRKSVPLAPAVRVLPSATEVLQLLNSPEEE